MSNIRYQQQYYPVARTCNCVSFFLLLFLFRRNGLWHLCMQIIFSPIHRAAAAEPLAFFREMKNKCGEKTTQTTPYRYTNVQEYNIIQMCVYAANKKLRLFQNSMYIYKYVYFPSGFMCIQLTPVYIREFISGCKNSPPLLPRQTMP